MILFFFSERDQYYRRFFFVGASEIDLSWFTRRVITAPRIFAVLVNDVYKFYFMCMVKFINLRFVN